MLKNDAIYHSIPLERIDLGDRYRKDYGDLAELMESIKANGLINPITVSRHPQVEESFLLLAGGRRLRSHELLKLTEISCRVYDREVNDLELRTIELAENIHRKDLNFAEKIRTEQEIHKLQLEIYGPKVSTSPDALGHSQRDTAKMLNISPAKLVADLKLAKTMEQFPELEWDKCKNQIEATRLQDKIGTTIIRQHLAKKAVETLGESKTDKFKKTIIDSFIVGDFFEGVKSLPDETFDLVEIDPPYAIDIGKVKKRDIGSKYDYGEGGYNEISAKNYPAFLFNTFTECYRVMKPNSWLLCWFGPDPWFEPIYNWLNDAGFKTLRLTGAWIKPTGQCHNPTKHLANARELFYYAWKGIPTLTKAGSTNNFLHNPMSHTKKKHPTERPIELYNDILTTFVREDSKVLVPYAGSGKTLLSAAINKMHAVGFDKSQDHKDGFIMTVNETLV